MRVSWERLGGVLGVLGCVLAVLVVLGHQHFRFFLNSGTLKGSSRVFRESQGVPASVPESSRPGFVRSIFVIKTNTFSTFLLLVPTWCSKNVMKTNTCSTCLFLGLT